MLAGKTFSSNNAGRAVAGTMVKRGAVNQTITMQNGQYTIPQGYHLGSGKVTASFPNLIMENVKQGVNIGGVIGSLADYNARSGKVDLYASEWRYWYATPGKKIVLAYLTDGWTFYTSFWSQSPFPNVTRDNVGGLSSYTTVFSIFKCGH